MGGDAAAIPILTTVLSTVKEDTMVRHEAGEALGAIGDEIALEVLTKHLKDPVVEVAETCELAVERIEWLKTQRQTAKGESLSDNPYNSVATPEAFRVLTSHVDDPVQVVRESCQVALDMAEHEVSGELQYADTLAKIK